MSQPNRKNKRLEALFSEKKPAPPNPAPSLLDNEPGAPKSENAESAALQGQPASTTSDAGMPGDQAAAESLVEQPESKDWLAPVARRGIFARITGVFDRLSYPRKFILVSLLFLLPTLVFLPLLNEQWQRIEQYGRQELRGVDYLQSLHHVLNELHVYQIEAARHDAGEISLTKLQESASKVDGSFVELTLAHDRNGAPLQLTDEPTRLIAQWTAIKKGAMAGEDMGAPLAQLVTDLQKLIFNVGNTSNLILDPDLDTYYTMDAVLLKLPENQVLLSQILSLSNEAARNRQLTPEQRAQITVLAGRYQNNLDVLHTNLEVALQNNDSGQMRPMIQSSMGNYFASAAQFLSRLKVEIINTSIIDVDSETILESGKQLMVAQQALIKDSSTALESGIQNRIDASTTRLILQFGFAVITGLLAFLLGMSIMRAISVPLQSLTTAAERLTHGDMGARVTVLSGDEVGKAAAAFNAMVDRLQQTLTMLTDRTHDLTLAAEVSQHISEVRDVSALLTNATELIRQRFDLYYAQVYLLDNNSRNLVLRGGTGTVGQELLRRGFRLPVSMASINGTAVLEQRAIIISDTAQTVNFRPNPLLPKTRSEMCVPLLAGERVLGVLDLQSERPGDFSEENLPVFNTLVGQLTIALQNAALYTQAQESRLDLEAQISAISDKGWRDFLNAVERGQKLGYAFDQVQVSALNGESLQPIPVDTALSVPLQAAGADLGLIQVTNEPDHVWERRDVEVTHAVAVRLSQHIDNLRLLAQAEQYRDEAEQAVRRLTREGWDSYLQGERAPASGFEFDLNQVHPLNDSGNGHEPSGIVEPLTVRNEQIGEISAPIAEEEAKEIVSAIAAQLSEHIENLRLFEQTQTALFTTQQSQAKLSEALNIAKLGNWEYDFDNDLFTFNDQFYSIFHTTAEKVGGYKLSSARYAELFVHPDDAALVGQEIGRAIASTERHFSANLEHRTLYADGGIGYMTVEIHLERDEKGKIIRWYGANQDITERKLAELVIQESEAKLSEALNIARLANWEYDVEKDLFTFNDNFYSIFHTTASEVGGYKLSAMDYAQRFVHPEDMPIVGKEIEKALSSTDRHYSTRLEHRVLFADGGIGYISVEIHIDRDEDGKILRYYGANQDITERKLAELVIQESEAKLSEALNIARLANWEYDVEKDLFTFNDNFYSIFHTTVQEVGGYKLSAMDYAQRFVHPEDMPIVGKEIEKALSSTDRHYSTNLEHRVLFADGGMGYISVEIHIDRDEDGKIVRYYGANQDITERKKAELVIQESEAKLSEALQIAKLANWEYDVEKDLFTFNDNFYSIFHTTAKEVGGYQLSSMDYAQRFVHPEDMPIVGGEIEKALSSTDRHYSTRLEHRVLFADGGTGYISVEIHIDRDEDGKIIRYYGANQDITERKLAELAVQESEAKLSEALQIAKLANWDYDFDNDQFIFNDHFYSIFHTTAEKVGGYKLSSAQYAQLFVHPDDAALVGDEIGKAIASTKKHFTTKLEHRVIYADGGVGYISVDVHVDRDENGKIVRWYGANQDITERKKAEEVVRLAQERAQIILETVTIPMVITRISDNVLTFINQPATETANVKYEEAINRPAPDFYYNPDDRKKFIAELRERGRVFDMVVQLKRGDEPFWALLSARIFNYQNEPSILTTFMDITDRINAEEAVARRATELQTVAEVSTTTATTLQPEHLLQSVVDLTRERFGLYHAHIYLADDAWQTLLLAAGAGEVGRHMVADGWNIPIDHPSSIVADAARSRRSVIANDVYRDQESGFLSNKLLPETRSEMAVPMIAGDKVLGVFDVQSDVAGRFSQEDANIYTTLASQVAVALQNARLYMEQAATVTQLRELDRLKSAFLANMSHELRTPLNSILGFADVMLEELDGPLTEYMDNDLRLIQKNGQHLLHLINDVLDMAKIEAGRMNLNPEQFRVYEVLEEVTSITSPLASEKNLSLFIDEASDQDTEIYADRTRLRQVMINLVNNSIKFTETGKIAVKVKPIDGGRVLISVKDTGIGIPPDKLEAVFLEFTQVDTSTTRKVGGTGLGLPISRRLVEMHGGRLWAESTGVNGEGATFFVELPLEARITEVIEKQAK